MRLGVRQRKDQEKTKAGLLSDLPAHRVRGNGIMGRNTIERQRCFPKMGPFGGKMRRRYFDAAGRMGTGEANGNPQSGKQRLVRGANRQYPVSADLRFLRLDDCYRQ